METYKQGNGLGRQGVEFQLEWAERKEKEESTQISGGGPFQ